MHAGAVLGQRDEDLAAAEARKQFIVGEADRREGEHRRGRSSNFAQPSPDHVCSDSPYIPERF